MVSWNISSFHFIHPLSILQVLLCVLGNNPCLQQHLQHCPSCHPEHLLPFHFCLFSMISLLYDAEVYPKLRGVRLNFRQRQEWLILNSDPNLQFPVSLAFFDTAFQLWHSHAYFILTFPSVWECCCLGQRTGIPESGTHILLNYSLHGLYD